WLMMSLWDALRMNMMISYQELVRTFPKKLSFLVHQLKLRFTFPDSLLGEGRAVRVTGCFLLTFFNQVNNGYFRG
ncbi:hypothetical protein, partial [Escherichia coli]|uniref:hypothetical protein n=1 Tax=Escherichia coli TaxID=562 RepID=UPI000BE3A047